MNTRLSATELVDLDFIATRHKLLDVAAFLDRVDRAGAAEDYRVRSLREAVRLLERENPDRASALLDHFSDPTIEPIPTAPGKGATGAPRPGTGS